MAFQTNPNLKRIPNIKGWKNTSFPNKISNYPVEATRWLKAYLLLKAYLALHGLQLVLCQIQSPNHGSQKLYLTLQRLARRQRRTKLSVPRRQSQILRALSFVTHKEPVFTLYAQLRMVLFFLTTRRNLTSQIMTKTLWSKLYFIQGLNFFKKLTTLRTRTKWKMSSQFFLSKNWNKNLGRSNFLLFLKNLKLQANFNFILKLTTWSYFLLVKNLKFIQTILKGPANLRSGDRTFAWVLTLNKYLHLRKLEQNKRLVGKIFKPWIFSQHLQIRRGLKTAKYRLNKSSKAYISSGLFSFKKIKQIRWKLLVRELRTLNHQKNIVKGPIQVLNYLAKSKRSRFRRQHRYRLKIWLHDSYYFQYLKTYYLFIRWMTAVQNSVISVSQIKKFKFRLKNKIQQSQFQRVRHDLSQYLFLFHKTYIQNIRINFSFFKRRKKFKHRVRHPLYKAIPRVKKINRWPNRLHKLRRRREKWRKLSSRTSNYHKLLRYHIAKPQKLFQAKEKLIFKTPSLLNFFRLWRWYQKKKKKMYLKKRAQAYRPNLYIKKSKPVLREHSSPTPKVYLKRLDRLRKKSRQFQLSLFKPKKLRRRKFKIKWKPNSVWRGRKYPLDSHNFFKHPSLIGFKYKYIRNVRTSSYITMYKQHLAFTTQFRLKWVISNFLKTYLQQDFDVKLNYAIFPFRRLNFYRVDTQNQLLKKTLIQFKGFKKYKKIQKFRAKKLSSKREPKLNLLKIGSKPDHFKVVNPKILETRRWNYFLKKLSSKRQPKLNLLKIGSKPDHFKVVSPKILETRLWNYSLKKLSSKRETKLLKILHQRRKKQIYLQARRKNWKKLKYLAHVNFHQLALSRFFHLRRKLVHSEKYIKMLRLRRRFWRSNIKRGLRKGIQRFPRKIWSHGKVRIRISRFRLRKMYSHLFFHPLASYFWYFVERKVKNLVQGQRWALKNILRRSLPIFYIFTKYLEPQILADYIARELQSSPQHKKVLYTVQALLTLIPFNRLVGYRVGIFGRLNSSDKTRMMYFTRGHIALEQNAEKISFASTQSRARIGTIGVKIWIYF